MSSEVRKIRRSVQHQGIGGKEIYIDKQVSRNLTPKTVYNRGMEGNWACYNFIQRRWDFDPEKFPYKLYYGKVGMLGYIVAEDELEEEWNYGK